MKLLADTCVGVDVVAALRAAGHDVVHSAEWSDDPGDEAILRLAASERRSVVTRDKDFGTLAVLHGWLHGGVIQLRHLPIRLQAAACLEAVRKHASALEAGALVTVEPGRIRVRFAL